MVIEWLKLVDANPAKMMSSSFRTFLLYFLLGQSLLAQPAIIFDTDIGSDCDDAGALAVLHKLADKEEIIILGTIFSSNANPYGIGTAAAINQYYGRGDLPLGQYQGPTIIGDPDHVGLPDYNWPT